MTSKKLLFSVIVLVTFVMLLSIGFVFWSTGHFQPKLACPPAGTASHGDCLTGLQPSITSCPLDAKTIDVLTVAVGNNTSVTAELRQSKKCNASWVRLSVTGSPGIITELGLRQDTGFSIKNFPSESNFTVGIATSFTSPVLYNKDSHKAYGYFVANGKTYRTKSM